MIRLRTLLAALLMLILPLQGIAAGFAPLHRLAEAGAAGNLPCHEVTALDSTAIAPEHGEAEGDGTPTSPAPRDVDAASHLCCHQVLSCAANVSPPTPSQKFGDVPRFVLPLATLFIPDSPDRPPRG